MPKKREGNAPQKTPMKKSLQERTRVNLKKKHSTTNLIQERRTKHSEGDNPPVDKGSLPF